MNFLKTAASVFFIAITFALPATANDLTEMQVRSFLMKENDLLKQNAGKSSPKAIKNYLEKHLTGKFKYKDTVTSHLGQFGSSTENISYNRDQYIESIVGNIGGLKGIESKINIKDIKISGKSAIVRYSTEANLKAENEEFAGKSADGFGIESNSDCTSDIRWNSRRGVIQTEKLVCKTSASMDLQGMSF